MKLRSYFYAALCGLAITAGFTACSDDDDEDSVASTTVVNNVDGLSSTRE